MTTVRLNLYFRISERPQNTPANVKTSNWIPQVDILANEKTKIFISHCGNHGAHESLFNGVPVLGVPLFFDQFYIAKRIEDIGLGLQIYPSQFKSEKVKETILKLLSSEFEERAKDIQFRIQNQPVTDLDYALRQIEYLMKTGDFNHLKPAAIPFIEYYNIDVYISILFLLSPVYLFIKYICCLRFRTKVKTE